VDAAFAIASSPTVVFTRFNPSHGASARPIPLADPNGPFGIVSSVSINRLYARAMSSVVCVNEDVSAGTNERTVFIPESKCIT
jgi:hypothetical protein